MIVKGLETRWFLLMIVLCLQSFCRDKGLLWESKEFVFLGKKCVTEEDKSGHLIKIQPFSWVLAIRQAVKDCSPFSLFFVFVFLLLVSEVFTTYCCALCYCGGVNFPTEAIRLN